MDALDVSPACNMRRPFLVLGQKLAQLVIGPARSKRMSVDDPINRPFVGLQWEDHLFQIDNQQRELAASWKIMRSPQYMALADRSWRLRAIGIPLWLAAPGLQGDIDILLGRWCGPGGLNPQDTIYRAFELKTSKVTREGKVTSLKVGKFHKTLGQLGKLWELGAQEVFSCSTPLSCRVDTPVPGTAYRPRWPQKSEAALALWRGSHRATWPWALSKWKTCRETWLAWRGPSQ